MGVGFSSNIIYYSISNGKIVRQFQSATKNSVERVNRNLRIVHEEFYETLDGYLTDIFIKVTEYGKFWNVRLRDQQSPAIQNLQFGYSSGYALSFLKALPNVNVAQPITIVPNVKKDGDKVKTTIFIKQANVTLKWFYTREHPSGLPPLKKMKLKGKDVWDDAKTMEFLENMVKAQVLPKILKNTSTEILSTDMNNDGLPF